MKRICQFSLPSVKYKGQWNKWGYRLDYYNSLFIVGLASLEFMNRMLEPSRHFSIYNSWLFVDHLKTGHHYRILGEGDKKNNMLNEGKHNFN